MMILELEEFWYWFVVEFCERCLLKYSRFDGTKDCCLESACPEDGAKSFETLDTKLGRFLREYLAFPWIRSGSGGLLSVTRSAEISCVAGKLCSTIIA